MFTTPNHRILSIALHRFRFPLVLTVAAVLGLFVSHHSMSGADGGTAFFFFFFSGQARERFLPSSWKVAGRFVIQGSPVLVALAPPDAANEVGSSDGVVALQPPLDVPPGWQRVISISRGSEPGWTLMASAVGRLGDDRLWTDRDPVSVVKEALGLPSRSVDDSHADPIRLRNLFRMAVLRKGAREVDVPEWLGDRVSTPQGADEITLDMFGRTVRVSAEARADGFVTAWISTGLDDSAQATEEPIPTDLLGALVQLRARDLLPNLPAAESALAGCEHDVLNALMSSSDESNRHAAVDAPDPLAPVTSLERLFNEIQQVRTVLASEEESARRCAEVTSALGSAPSTNAESAAIRSLFRDLDAAADELRVEGRTLVQLAAPLAAEERARKEASNAETQRKRTDRVILVATIGATVLGVPALIAGFFGASVTPLDKASPVGFWDLVIASACLAILTGAGAELMLHRPRRKVSWWRWSGRLLVLLVPPTGAAVWTRHSDALDPSDKWPWLLASAVSLLVLILGSVGEFLERRSWRPSGSGDDQVLTPSDATSPTSA